jgi:hypothetical protein
MRQAAHELGQWDTKSETAAVDPAEMVRLLHKGRRRARGNWEARKLEVLHGRRRRRDGATAGDHHEEVSAARYFDNSMTAL